MQKTKIKKRQRLKKRQRTEKNEKRIIRRELIFEKDNSQADKIKRGGGGFIYDRFGIVKARTTHELTFRRILIDINVTCT